ncbi:MAG: integrase [Geobacter sp.]|nr:MAG: integrase [Geobacter sp.]
MPKRITPLSEIQVRNAKPKAQDYKLMDGFGLYLLVTPTGGKLWRFDYRCLDKRKVVAFGAYPAVSLADARQRREDARKLLSNGVDPAEVKKAQKAATVADAENSFEVVTREWHEKFKGKWVASHAQHKLERFEKNVFPWIGKMPIAEVKATDVLAVLRRIESRNLLDTAHRVKTDCGQVLRYAVATGRAERDCTADLKDALPPAKSGHFSAPTDPKAVAQMLKAIDGFTGSFVVQCAMKLAPMLFVRPGELRAAEWSEIDLEAAEWNIPGHKMKMKEPHLVPLSTQAVSILRELRPLTGHSKYVFPCNRSPLRCMSENAVNGGLRRLGFEKSEITGHGFRATARTMIHEVLGFSPDAIEAQLSHAVPDRLGKAYNRTQHLAERRKLMQTWSDYLDGLKSGAKVIPLKRTGGQ